MVRQIGDEYWGEWVPPSLGSTDTREIRIKYKVVGIEEVLEFGNHGRLIYVERVEPINIEERYPDKYFQL